jgi:hypothetical protein
MNRLSIALLCYVALGVLTWSTITDPKFRGGTLAILALFAVKSVLRRNQVLHPDKQADAESKDLAQAEGREPTAGFEPM